MAANTSFLEVSDHGDGEEREEQTRNQLSGWEKMLDLEEAKTQIFFSFPMILTNVCYSLITLVSVMLAGHLGKLQLAGATLANSWATVTGFAFMIGLSGALETLCGQGFGAKEYRMLGIFLQASCIISFLLSIVISIIWFYTEPILVLFHQDRGISKEAALYMKFLIPGLFAFCFQQNILRFLQTQSIVMPLALLSFIPLIVHIGIAYALVHCTPRGFKGAPLATSISLWISIIVLFLYVICAKKFKQTWQGFSSESFSYIFLNLKVALPSAAMVCLEDWVFKVMIFLAGIMPDSKITTSLIAMCVNKETIAYMITYGLSAAASTRASNELGAGHPNRAKNAMAVSLKLSVLLAFLVVLALTLGHSIWAQFFSGSPAIIQKFASMTPYLAISIILDSLQGVLSGLMSLFFSEMHAVLYIFSYTAGVASGCGWQKLVVYVNLATFYPVGIPIAYLLGFKFKLYAKGLWIGIISGLSCQAGTLLLITNHAKWTKLNIPGYRDKESSSPV